MTLNPIAKTLIVLGALLVLAGIGWQLGWIQALRLGHLPGDISIERENVRVYFPLTTGLLLSVILSLIAWLLKSGPP